MPLIDLSHVIEDGMVTDPRLPAPVVRDVWTREQSASRYAPGVSFQIGAVDLVQNTGTYLDAPFHRHAAMAGVWDFPLERTADLPGVRIDVRRVVERERRAIEPGDFGAADVQGAAALFWTGFDKRWGSEEYRSGRHPYLTGAAARSLVERGAVLFGVDAINADDFADLTRPAHTILLGAGMGIVENLTNLGALPARGFRFTAAPVKVRGLGSFPVRAFALVE
jgi:kynurenine formamidase